MGSLRRQVHGLLILLLLFMVSCSTRQMIPSDQPSQPPSNSVPSARTTATIDYQPVLENLNLPSSYFDPTPTFPPSNRSTIPLPEGQLYFIRNEPKAREQTPNQVTNWSPSDDDQAYVRFQEQEMRIDFPGGTVKSMSAAHLLLGYRRLEGQPGITFRLLNLARNQVEEIELTCAPLPCQLLVSPDQQWGALNYRCDLEDSPLLLAPIPELQQHMEEAMEQVRPACPARRQEAFAWTSDATTVLYAGMDALWERDTAGHERRIAPGQWFQPHLAADDRSILAVKHGDTDNSSTLWLIDRVTGDVQQIPVVHNQVSEALLSPSGRYVIYSINSFVDSGQCLYLIDREHPTQEPDCVTSGYRLLAWLPDN